MALLGLKMNGEHGQTEMLEGQKLNISGELRKALEYFGILEDYIEICETMTEDEIEEEINKNELRRKNEL